MSSGADVIERAADTTISAADEAIAVAKVIAPLPRRCFHCGRGGSWCEGHVRGRRGTGGRPIDTELSPQADTTEARWKV
jgi:hypothetical protein